jgi:hypothetical protein
VSELLPAIKYLLWCLSTGLAFAGAWFFKFAREDDGRPGHLVLTRPGKVALPIALSSFVFALILQVAEDRTATRNAREANDTTRRLDAELKGTREMLNEVRSYTRDIASFVQTPSARQPNLSGPVPAPNDLTEQPPTKPSPSPTESATTLTRPRAFFATNANLGFGVSSTLHGVLESDGRVLSVRIEGGELTLRPDAGSARYIRSIRAALMGLNDQNEARPIAYSNSHPIEQTLRPEGALTLRDVSLPISLARVVSLAGHWVYFQIFERDTPESSEEAFSVVPTPRDTF